MLLKPHAQLGAGQETRIDVPAENALAVGIIERHRAEEADSAKKIQAGASFLLPVADGYELKDRTHQATEF